MARRRSSKTGRTGSSKNDRNERRKIKNKLLAEKPVFSPDTFDEMTTYLALLDKVEINQRNEQGHTLLHTAASVGDMNLVRAVLDNQYIDAHLKSLPKKETIPIRETAVDLALAEANFGAAYTILKSHPQNLCILLPCYSSSLDRINKSFNSCHSSRRDNIILSSELFLFGSNVNNSLGFGDSNDRSRPKSIKFTNNDTLLDSPVKYMEPSVMDVCVSKRHSAVLLDKPSNNLLVCGLGARLGLGDSESPFKYTAVNGLKDLRIVKMALGIDHTVVITSNGDCYTWGSNQNGQLGYNTESKDQRTPKKVSGEIRKKSCHLIGCSASNIYTIVYTDRDIYCWGKNSGQMSFTTISEKQIEVNPRLMSRNNWNILDVCCSDIATIVLLQNHEIFAYMNHGNFRVILDSSTALNNQKLMKYTEIRMSNNGWLAVKTPNHSIHTCDLRIYKNDKVTNSSRTLISTLVVYHDEKDEPFRMDISDDGSMIISTEKEIWKVHANNNPRTMLKWEFVSFINRIQKVVCDSSFESFAAIRRDVSLPYTNIETKGLLDDMHYLVPFVNEKQSSNMDVLQRLRLFPDPSNPSDEFESFSFEQRISGHLLKENEENSDTESMISDEDLDDKNGLIKRRNERLLSYFKPNSMNFSRDLTGYDFNIRIIGSDEISNMKVHAAVLFTRCKRLNKWNSKHETEETFHYNNGFGKRIQYKRQEKTLEFGGFKLSTITLFIYCIYTGYVPNSLDWLDYKDVLLIRKQLVEIGKILEFEDLESYSYGNGNQSIGTDLMQLRDNPKLFPDVIFHLSQGKTYHCHSYILRCRSSYFDTLLSERWSSTDEELRQFDFDEISYEDFDVIMLHIYGDLTHDIFRDIKVEDSKEFVLRLLSIMKLADLFLLSKLIQLCEAAILLFLNVKNVLWLLEETDLTCSPQLEWRILFYICSNLKCLVENDFLDGISDDSLIKIDRMFYYLTDTIGFWKEYAEDSMRERYYLGRSDKFYQFVNNLKHHDISSDDEGKKKCKEKDVLDKLVDEGIFDMEDVEKIMTKLKKMEKDSENWTIVGEKKKKKQSISDLPKSELDSSTVKTDLSNISTPSKSISRITTPQSNRSSITSTPINIGSPVITPINKPATGLGSGSASGLTSGLASSLTSGPSSVNGSLSSIDTPLKNWTKSPKTGSLENIVFPALGDASSKETRRQQQKKFEKAAIKSLNQSPSSLTSVLSGNKGVPNKQAGHLSEANDQKSSNVEINTSSSKKFTKLSQKDRKRLNQEEKSKPKKSTNQNPWNVTPPLQVYGTMFDQTSKKGKAKLQEFVAENTFSFTDISKQTQLEAERRKVKNLEEIQQEQRFEQWWAKESAKVQQQMKKATLNDNKNSRKHEKVK